MKKILVTGHTGMLGRNLVSKLTSEGFEVFGVSKSKKLNHIGVREYQLDLYSQGEVANLVESIRPDLIIHTAALTNLSFCEDSKTEAYKFHVTLTQTLANFRSARFIYISTDSVFDGEVGSYTELDPTYPQNFYAHTKLLGEWAAVCGNPNSLILRTNIYGFKKEGGNSLAEWALNSLKEKKAIKGYSDVFFNPLYVGQVSDLIVKFVHSTQSGLMHIGCNENISKFAFLRKMATTFDYSEDMILEAVSPKDTVLKRPKNTTLSINYLNEVIHERPSLNAGLAMMKKDYIRTYETN